MPRFERPTETNGTEEVLERVLGSDVVQKAKQAAESGGKVSPKEYLINNALGRYDRDKSMPEEWSIGSPALRVPSNDELDAIEKGNKR